MPRVHKREYKETYHVFFAKICLIVVCYALIFYSYLAFTSPITLGDSTGYHIPIAESILDGSFLYPTTDIFMVNPVMYYPGSSEAILSLFMLFSIPLNLYNILALFLLFAGCFLLGKRIFEDTPLAIIFASTIATLPVTQQWIITQFIDYWFALFFVVLLYLLLKPEKTIRYTLFLGICAGLFIGTKYSGPFILVILLVVYFKNIRSIFTLVRLTLFSSMAFIFGGFWYLRNFVFTGNPYFPQNLFSYDKDFLRFKVFDAIIDRPAMMLDALLSQYLAWSFAVILVPLGLYFCYRFLTKKVLNESIKLLIVAFLNFVVFLILPAEPGSYTHYVSIYRYSLTMFIPLIVIIFMIATFFKQSLLLYVIVVLTFLSLPQLTHHPKIVFILLPIATIIALYPPFLRKHLTKFL